MLSEVAVRNFKSLRDVRLGLERFTVIVGPNASGKSSVLQALGCFCRAFQPVIKSGAHGELTTENADLDRELLRSVSRGSQGPVELAAKADGRWFRYRTHRGKAGQAVCVDAGSDTWADWHADVYSPGPHVPASTLLRLEPSRLVEQSQDGSDPTLMAADGANLHSALASMVLNDPDSWQRLQADLRAIIPTVRRVRHSKPPDPALLFDTVGADALPAEQVSEGTLLVLGLLAALYAPERPSLVLLDDLDRGLHPRAQKDLVTLLRGLLTANPSLQIVATTHSPYLLDCMQAGEIRMTYLRDDGSTVCAPLTRHPKFQKWKDQMHPGELWSLFGEKWVAEQEAVG